MSETLTPKDLPANRGSAELNARIRNAENPAKSLTDEEVREEFANITGYEPEDLKQSMAEQNNLSGGKKLGKFADQLDMIKPESVVKPEYEAIARKVGHQVLDNAAGNSEIAELSLEKATELVSPSSLALPEHRGETVEDVDNL